MPDIKLKLSMFIGICGGRQALFFARSTECDISPRTSLARLGRHLDGLGAAVALRGEDATATLNFIDF